MRPFRFVKKLLRNCSERLWISHSLSRLTQVQSHGSTDPQRVCTLISLKPQFGCYVVAGSTRWRSRLLLKDFNLALISQLKIWIGGVFGHVLNTSLTPRRIWVSCGHLVKKQEEVLSFVLPSCCVYLKVTLRLGCPYLHPNIHRTNLSGVIWKSATTLWISQSMPI